MNSEVVKKTEDELYIVDEYQKNKIEKLKYIEDKILYVVNLANELKRFLEFKKHKIKNAKYYVVKINFKKYEIDFIDIKEFLTLNKN